MRDFTFDIYRLLLESLIKKGYNFLSFKDYIEKLDFISESNFKHYCILRHDVDRNPLNSLLIARLEKEFGIVGSYYFRIVPGSFNESIIKEISNIGHEIGYHYEEMDLVSKSESSKIKDKNKEDINLRVDRAYELFGKNLEKMRKVTDVKTICMHGSPLSKYDNKIIWSKYNYKDLNIVGEPYFDIDWNEFGYLTDTGRKWNGRESSVRDKVDSRFKFDFKSTRDIIANVDELPNKLMITLHPQRWNNNSIPWLTEYVSQNLKNIIKKYLYVKQK